MAYIDMRHAASGLVEGPSRPAPAAAETSAGGATDGLLRMFVRNQLKAAAALPFIAILFALAGLSWTPAPIVLSWLIGVLGMAALQVLLCGIIDNGGTWWRFSLAGSAWRRRERILELSELMQALVWSMPLFLFWQPDMPLQHIFIIAVLMVVAAVRILIGFTHTPVLLSGSGLIILAILVRCLLAGEALHIFLAAIALITGIFFLQLARRLQETAREMLVLKAQRERLIEELSAARDKAEAARSRAERANRAKSVFLASMSHELRTPLNAIMGFSEIIAEELFGPTSVPQYRDYAHDIHQSGQYLLSLINDILDLSRIEAGRRELSEEPLDLAAQAQDCLRLVSFRATERELTIVTRFDAEAPHVLADARAVRQMWLNLLGNAVKFTDPGGCIEVIVERTAEGGVVMAVRDNGSGVAEGEVREVLQSFSRGRSAVEGAVEGAGLGLSIVDGLARLHDATLHFDSVEGRGTHVRIVFPPHRVVRGGTPYHFEDDVSGDPARRRLVMLMDA